MESKKIIVFLTPAFPSHEQDWNWLPVLQRLSLSINAANPSYELKIISFSYPQQTKAYQWNGIEVFPYNLLDKKRITRIFSWLKIMGRLYLLRRDYDIVSIFSFWISETSFIGSWFARVFKIRFFAWICGQDAKPGNKFVRYSKLTNENTIAISDFIQTTFLKNYQIQSFRTMPFGVENITDQARFNERPIDIIGVGSLKPLKQFHLFIEAIAIIKKSFPKIQVRICGSGESKLDLLKQINELGLVQNIQLLGEVMHPDNLQLMSESKILLHSSNYEGMSAACLEALGAGCYVISFVKSMNADVENWQIAETVTDMAEKAIAILNNPPVNSKHVIPFPIHQTASSVIELSCL